MENTDVQFFKTKSAKELPQAVWRIIGGCNAGAAQGEILEATQA